MRDSLPLLFCPLLYGHNLLAEEGESLVFLQPAQHRFYNLRRGQFLAYDETQGITGPFPQHALPTVMTDIRRLASDFNQVLAEHAESREHLGHPTGQQETAAAPPCLLTWEDGLDALMFSSRVDQLIPPLAPRILLGGSQIVWVRLLGRVLPRVQRSHVGVSPLE